MAYFPMMVNITGKPVLLVGGGKEGLQKIEVLSMFYPRKQTYIIIDLLLIQTCLIIVIHWS